MENRLELEIIPINVSGLSQNRINEGDRGELKT